MFNPWKPWKEGQIKYPQKSTEYFHQRDGIWNSLAHSSPKISQFYLKPNFELNNKIKIQNSTSPTTSTSIENTIRKTASRERIKKRKLEREILQAKSSQCLLSFHIKDDVQSIFSTFKDPASKPINKMIGSFNNYNELPEDRLKLVVNRRILKKDAEALSLISKKIAKEFEEEKQKKEWHKSIREQSLTRMRKRRKENQIYEQKAGIEKIKPIQKATTPVPNMHIKSLSIAKSVKIGYPEDYSESYGLLKAGVISSGRSIHPKSSRKPAMKKTDSFPVLINENPDEFSAENKKNTEIKFDEEVFTIEEIKESYKELNQFHKRFGELKGRVGFPHIYLEKYKNL
ncbi:hypothetical protein SteCoe_23296 [Stentor coeruleus]|uniref:Uncharacterized protein n=1 Tax=Stentor coeruleus TaxID=5963 RepID=A0A1R2BKK4_9CILI|nr:hypothetical protein SteCoe_23296 [Stentor coeruleus]